MTWTLASWTLLRRHSYGPILPRRMMLWTWSLRSWRWWTAARNAPLARVASWTPARRTAIASPGGAFCIWGSRSAPRPALKSVRWGGRVSRWEALTRTSSTSAFQTSPTFASRAPMVRIASLQPGYPMPASCCLARGVSAVVPVMKGSVRWALSARRWRPLTELPLSNAYRRWAHALVPRPL